MADGYSSDDDASTEGQGSLEGFGQPPAATDRLFFALYPAPAVARRADALRRALQARHALSGKPVHEDRLHVTLSHVGDFAGLPPRLVADAATAAQGLVQPAFDISFERATSFAGRPGSLPMILLGGQGVDAVRAFQLRLDLALRTAGVLRRSEAFTPHMTLAYDRQPLKEEPIDPIGWTAHEFVLVHSLIGQTVHKIIACFPLG